jgi:hypothetical protein
MNLKPINMNSNLTENQNNIITKLVSDFIELNNVKTVNTVVDDIKKANEHNLTKANFYANVKLNNFTVTTARDEMVNKMVIKLKTLFVNIHNITIKETDTHITLTNKDSQKCLFSFPTYVLRNTKTNSIRFNYLDDLKNLSVTKYDFAGMVIDNIRLSVDDFETSEIFKDKVFHILT